MVYLVHALVTLLGAPATLPAPAPAPIIEPVTAPAPAPAPAATSTGTIAGTVVITRGGPDGKPKADRAGVVVYLDVVIEPGSEGLSEANSAAPAAPATVHAIRQVNKAFVPAVSAVVKGTEVTFPNDDMVFHNVFSLSKSKRFDLGLYKAGTTKSVTLTRPGIIDVYCNIHPEMAAKILVLDNPHFAVTTADGRFTIPRVPAGEYPYVAWLARGEPVRGVVTVTAGGEARLDLKLVEVPQANLHTRKDGSPYGRYN